MHHGFNDVFSHEDVLPTILAAVGEPDIKETLKQGYKAMGRDYKVHIYGYNLLPYFKGEAKEGPRKEFCPTTSRITRSSRMRPDLQIDGAAAMANDSIRDKSLVDSNMQIKRAYLILAFATISIIALLYGISPAWFASTFLGVTDLSLNFAHILRAVMCLYLALGCFWLFAAFSDTHRNTAILTTILFAGGLVTGRLVSFIVDGQPAPLLSIYAGMEFALVPIAYWIYTRPE